MTEAVRLVGAERVPTNVVCELELTAARDHDDPWSAIELDVEFTDPDGRTVAVPAYWAGGRTWRVRYSSPTAGLHGYRSVVRSDGETGLEGFAGELTVTGYDGANPLLLHGGPRVADDGRHLAHADGEPFFWLGDTWWMGMIGRFRWPDTFQTLADDRAAKGFSVVQIVAGLVPECIPFSETMVNEGGQPWTQEGTGRVNPAFYSVPDLKIDYLVAKGIVPCIVGGWGFYANWLGEERVRRHWRYLVARYAAYPVVWCIAGEVDVALRPDTEFNPLEDGRPVEQVRIWEDASRMVGEIDPFGRVRTVHPSPVWAYASSEAFSSRDAFDLDMLQTGHSGMHSVPETMDHLHAALAHGDKPVLNGECSYEGIFDSCWQDVQRFLFWSHMLSGAAGHTYGTMAISTFNSREDPRWPLSRVSVHFWEDAIEWLGAAHVGVGRRILERFPWWELEPCREAFDPHAGPEDWILPYAARVADGTLIGYVPGSGMLGRDGWRDAFFRLRDLALVGLADGEYDCVFIDPRTGDEVWPMRARSVDGRLPLRREGLYATPTGEDWVLVARRVS
jgi:hypothetical protein